MLQEGVPGPWAAQLLEMSISTVWGGRDKEKLPGTAGIWARDTMQELQSLLD